MQLPSNKVAAIFVVIVLIVVLVIGGDVFFKKTGDSDVIEQIDADLILRRNTTNNSSVDRDGDGLADWQEVFYGSDPENPDTDGDGTLDGDEVDAGRDPTIPGPDDELVNTKTIIDSVFEAPGYTEGTLTDVLSKDLFSNYLSLRSSGNVSPENSEAIANNLVNQVSQNTQIQIKYFQSDLNITEGSKENITKYANEVAIAWIDYNRQIERLSSVNEEEYLNKSAELYKSAGEFLSNIEVPDVAVNIHVELVNNINTYGEVVSELALYEKDPVKALIGSQRIQVVYEDQVKLFTALANYFKDNDIIFMNNEIARFWNLFE